MPGSIPQDLVNKLYHGPIEEVLPRLPEKSVDCIFADPDYNVGIKYEGTSYKQGFEEYIESTVRWAIECERILKKDGNLFIINYSKNNAHLRARYLDSAFERVYEYVWVYKTNIGHGPTHFTTAHRSILHCTKSAKNRFYKAPVAVPYQNPSDRRVRKLIEEGSPGRMPYSWIEAQDSELSTPRSFQEDSWFEINLVKNVVRSKTFHSCQIPEALSTMLFRATCRKGDTVLVLFGGAGSELVVCNRLGLNWISAEMVPKYQSLIEERLKNDGEVPTKDRMLTAIRVRKRALANPSGKVQSTLSD